LQLKEAFAPGHRTLEPPLVPGPCLWNFGPPLLEEGSRFAAPLRTITPRDPRAVEGLSVHDVYGPPEPGSTEQVYFYELHAQSGRGSETLAMLRNQGGDKAVVLRFHADSQPELFRFSRLRPLGIGMHCVLQPRYCSMRKWADPR